LEKKKLPATKKLQNKIRTKLDTNSLSYVRKKNKTEEGYPFLRYLATTNFKVDNKDATYNWIIWMSNFQLLRFRSAIHIYVDGSFDVVPKGFKQLITILAEDAITKLGIPVAFMMLDSKTKASYLLGFQALHSIVTSLGEIQLNLKSVTLDFEKNFFFAFKEVFKLTIIPCLYHFKQALWRWLQRMRMTTTKYLEFTKSLIQQIGGLTFLKQAQVKDSYLQLKSEYTRKYAELRTKPKVKTEIDKQKEDCDTESEEDPTEPQCSNPSNQNTPLNKFWNYFERHYLNLIETQVLNYANIDQKYRSNSIIEGYHSLLQQKIPKKPNWPLFIKKLIEEEATVRKAINRNETEGTQFVHSKTSTNHSFHL